MEPTLASESELADTSYGCRTAGELLYMSLTVIIPIISITISIWTMYRYRKDHLFKLEHNTPSPNYLYRSCIAFYITCILYMLSIISGNLLRCFSYNIYVMIAQVGILSYIIHWGLIIAIYLGRLYFVFKDSPLQVPTKHLWYFVLFSVLLILCIIGVQVIRAMIDNYVMIILGWILSFSAAGILSLVLCAMFINKLSQLGKIDVIGVEEKGIQDTATKYSLLAIFSSFTTLLLIIWMCLMMVLPRTYIVTDIANILNLMDTFSDVIAVTLTFTFANTGYDKLCGICHNGLLKIYGNDAEAREIKKHQLQLEVGQSSNPELSQTQTDGVATDISSKAGEITIPTPLAVLSHHPMTGSNASGMSFIIT